MKKRLGKLRRQSLPVLVVALLAVSCFPGARQPIGEQVRLKILYTSDEHGWMAPTEEYGGAAGMMRRWREDEGYTEDGPFLILSGGDIWTGPALSTWFDGESMVEVMNAMGYTAAALGNHEFDFGREGLRERGAQAEFAFLGANALDTASGRVIEEALPYVIVEVGGVDVGIVGLASRRTPRVTMPTHVAGIDFAGYAQTLALTVSEARAEGADIVVVTSHLCGIEMNALSVTAAELGVAMIGGGHCNERIAKVENGVALVEAGWKLAAYGRVDLAFDPLSGRTTAIEVALKPNLLGQGDPEIDEIVARWQVELDDALLVAIGYTREGISRGSDAMARLVTGAWLADYPADIAMSNPGGFRQDIDPGEITLADIVGVLPFDNTLVDVAITGEQVIISYRHGARRPAVGGLTREGTRYLVNGNPLEPRATYHVLINDFMYAGGDGHAFAEYDPQAYLTGIDWRQPVIEWIIALKSSPDAPLEDCLDGRPRQR